MEKETVNGVVVVLMERNCSMNMLESEYNQYRTQTRILEVLTPVFISCMEYTGSIQYYTH